MVLHVLEILWYHEFLATFIHALSTSACTNFKYTKEPERLISGTDSLKFAVFWDDCLFIGSH